MKHSQLVVGTLLYHERAIESTMLPAIDEISSQQSQPTQETVKKWNQCMEYTAIYPNSYIRFHAIDMILILDTDAAYLFMPKSRSLIARYYYLVNKSNYKPHPELNGSIII